MPSFFRPPMPRHLPLSPPEFVPSYNANGCGSMQYQQQQQHYNAPGIGNQEEHRFDYSDRYGHHSGMAPQQMGYPQHAGYPNANASNFQPPPYYESVGAPILPLPMPDMNMQRPMQEQPRVDVPMKEEKPVGGVSAKLDYEMEIMTDFVSEMAQGMYALFNSPICLADIDVMRSIQPGRPSPPSFRKWVHQVLCATRLPSATILLSLSYLSTRMEMSRAPPKGPDSQIYRLLTTALMLGSKFLDDNTFINRSWSEVSGIDVVELNHLERDWLKELCYNLHRDTNESRGFSSWHEHWKDYEARAAARIANQTKLAPIDTRVQNNMSRLRSLPKLPSPVQSTYAKSISSCESLSQHGTPGYQHDPWRSTTERSPASAPHTGPTTPEYYGGPGTWAPPEGYTRRSIFGFPPYQLPSPQEQAPLFTPAAYTPAYGHHLWSGHGVGCNCIYCARQHPPYFMAAGFPQSVAG